MKEYPKCHCCGSELVCWNWMRGRWDGRWYHECWNCGNVFETGGKVTDGMSYNILKKTLMRRESLKLK